ncbi:actin-regulating kinase prk1 [Asimina triloba]
MTPEGLLLQPLLLLLLALFFHVLTSPFAASAADADVLLKFKDSLGNNASLSNWVQGSSPCEEDGTANWIGVRCSNASVRVLRLEGMSLTGRPNIDVLIDLPALRTLSLANNGLDGPMPSVEKLGKLWAVYLSGNRFSGEIAANTFEGIRRLKKVYLSRNEFTGPIPSSLAGLGQLLELGLEENRFIGKIPDFPQREWKYMNMSHNQLEDRIPATLSKADVTSFSGNKNLCGKPMENKCKKSKTMSTPLLIALIIVGTTAALAIAGTILIVMRRLRTSQDTGSSNPKKAASSVRDGAEDASPEYAGAQEKKAAAAVKDYGQGTLVFAREYERGKFELQDLLRASAQVLGNGTLGSTYKAILLSGPTVAVKRHREMSGVGKEEFQDHMKTLGKLTHPNLLPLLAFYYRKEEKLLVSDYADHGSLMQLLHGNQSESGRQLDWPTRLKIVRGVARGMAYLHKELPNLTLPHGHLKSSNVLLTHTFDPLLADYALAPMLTKDAKHLLVAYQSPECSRHGHTTNKSDVWCLGMLILELLTGRSPGNCNGKKGGGTDLAGWVNSVVREEWTGEVFDGEMGGTKHGEGEMLKLLQVGMGCCEWDVEKRWGLAQAVERIEELKEREGEEYSSYGSEGDMYSSKDEEFSFSRNV